jgi:hypothetical protein
LQPQNLAAELGSAVIEDELPALDDGAIHETQPVESHSELEDQIMDKDSDIESDEGE